MISSLKSLLAQSLVILLGLSLFCNATAAQSRDQLRTNRQIEACLAEISRHADYDKATRVIHWIASLDQKNLLELRIVVDTTVVLTAGDRTRGYHASCVTDTMGTIVEFRINTTQTNDEYGSRHVHS